MSQMTSRKVAVVAFAANLVVCGLTGTSLLLLRPSDGTADAAVPKPSGTPTARTSSGPTESQSPPSAPTSATSKPSAAGDFENTSGPGGITTKIPAGWPAKVRAGKTDAQATDPANPTSFLRYGGSAAPSQPLIEVMRNAEHSFSTQYPGYKLIGLQAETWREHEAVSWKFEFDTADGRKHVESVYWRVGQLDYVLYASSLVTNWPAMQGIYTTAYDATQP